MELKFRVALENDVWPLMALYQKVGSTLTDDSLFLEYEKLLEAVLNSDSLWMLGEDSSGTIRGVVCVLLDRNLGIAKISRMMVNPDFQDYFCSLQLTVAQTVKWFEEREPLIDVIYSTTLTLPLQLQEVTLKEGFHILGVFPNAIGVDQSKLNGLTVYYKKDVLKKFRSKDIELHEKIYPFFEIAKKILNLPPATIAKSDKSLINSEYEPLPPLELIKAPRLVRAKLDKLKSHQSMVVNFFPFLRPNAIICDADENVEVFVRIMGTMRFAAIIGEHLKRSIHPVELYESVLKLLRAENVSYVEAINDAADIYGTQCFLEAGFTPCAYIPAFKGQDRERRDYVVYTRSFEYLCRLTSKVEKGYLDFFKEYWKLEKRNYFFDPSLDDQFTSH